MTHRERHIPAEAPAHNATRLPPAGASEHGYSTGEALPSPNETSLWSDWYHRASPAQQQEALLRAMQQGLLYAHQMEPPAQAASPPRSFLSGLLNGQVKELAPLHPQTLECQDRDLDRMQREAVTRAIATPDICLIQGFPGTGKSRLVTEIILQAAQRGERVLFLASTTAALDTVLERLSSNPAVCPLRCLAEHEQPASLPPSIARLTLQERLRSYRETTLPAAGAARASAAGTLEARLREQPQWARLAELAEQQQHLAEQVRDLSDRRQSAVGESEQCSADFRERWQACERTTTAVLERVDAQRAGVQAELETITGKLNHLDSEWEAIRPLAEARQGRRFWTVSWWRALLQNGLKEQARDLEVRRDELRAAKGRLEEEVAARRGERSDLENQHAVECRRLQEEELARRRAELDTALAAAAREQEALCKQWQTVCAGVCRDAAPVEMTRQAVQEGLAVWEQLRQRDAQRLASAEQWLQTVEEGTRTLPEKLASCANVIAATTTAWSVAACGLALAAKPQTASLPGGSGGSPAFDVLMLEEAHQVTESEFAAAARHARRWVLIGEPSNDAELIAEPRKTLRSAVLRPGLFQRLWQNLHADPHRLPFTWSTHDGRLLCRLRPISPEQEKWIETEPLVDRPDIELRILSMPRQAPQVVEILFSACMGIAEAKQLLFSELDELAVQTRGRSLLWTETAEQLLVELAPSGDAESLTIALENGVRERLAALQARDGISWQTCCLEFARSAGWTRQSAEAWISERLGLRCSGRTVLLTVPYRLDPPLASVLSDLLFAGACQPATTPAKVSLSRPPVEFVMVPALLAGEGRDRGGQAAAVSSKRDSGAVSVRTPRPRTVKAGAGLEVDLADNPLLPQLPVDLRARLPRQGLVNYLEARALVKRLETLLQENDFLSACQRWRQRPQWPCGHGCQSPSSCDCPHTDNAPAVAVMAVYSAQVELLRHLIGQTPALRGSPITIEVGPPSAFSHRECLFALVSLTRSHTHRAVSYADHPQTLAQALTRASSGLILFGDPGTLARRSQWRGPLDHLDERAAQYESILISQLVQYLHGQGPHPEAFSVREGISV